MWYALLNQNPVKLVEHILTGRKRIRPETGKRLVLSFALSSQTVESELHQIKIYNDVDGSGTSCQSSTSNMYSTAVIKNHKTLFTHLLIFRLFTTYNTFLIVYTVTYLILL